MTPTDLARLFGAGGRFGAAPLEMAGNAAMPARFMGQSFPAAPQPMALAPNPVDPVTTAGTAQQKPSFMDGLKNFRDSERGQALSDMFAGWAMGGNLNESLGYGARSMMAGRESRTGKAKQEAERNQTVEWLKSQGMAPEQAQAIAGNPSVLTDVLKQMVAKPDPMDALKTQKLQLEVDQMRNPQPKMTDDMVEYQEALRGGYRGSFTDWQTKGVKDQDATFSREQGLRKEYIGTPEYKRFDDVRASYERIRASAQRGTGAGDLGTIFGFMKMLDPGSVVREGEFANAENSAGVPDRIRNLYNKIMEGQRLTPEQRAEFVSTADELYKQEAGRIGGLNTRYGQIAGQYQLDPKRIVIDVPSYEPMNLGGPAQVTTKEQMDALPSGSQFIAPDGTLRRKP